MTLHFLLDSSCVQFNRSFRNNQGYGHHPLPAESYCSCGKMVQKIIPTFAEPITLLREPLRSNMAEARAFRNSIRNCNRNSAMASMRGEFVSRCPGVSKCNPTITVH